MLDLRFAARTSDALKGQDHLVVFAPKAAFAPQLVKATFTRAQAALVDRMLDGATPGALGRVVSTYLPSGSPRRLSIAVLPDTVSRHLPPSRALAIAECVGKADISNRERTGVVVCLDEAAHVVAATNAVAARLARFSRKTRREPRGRLTLACVDRQGKRLAPGTLAPAVAEASRWAASLVDMPTADLTTEGFVEESRRFLKSRRRAKATVITGDALLAKGLRGIHAVGRAALVPPRMLLLEHAPEGARRTVALVGKGVVFDTGGLDLKTREGMGGMKCDMGGAAAVVGAFSALVANGCPDRLVALLPLAENAVGPASYRPDEILTLHSGRTVEINNTDAEGRLLLADAVSYAVREVGADVVIDAATLTGAQSVSTGRKHAAVVSNLAGLERRAVVAGLASGDPVHPLPFAPEIFQREFKSPVADMRNSVRDRANAQSSCAAQFVWSHVSDRGVPWLHVDLAGPAISSDRGTGYGVALLAEVVRTLQPSDLVG